MKSSIYKLLLDRKAKIYEKPVLGYILAKDDPSSAMYVRLKKKECDKLGIEYKGYEVNQNITERELVNYVKELERD